MPPKHACSFCGDHAKTLHQISFPRGTYLTCGTCVKAMAAECAGILEATNAP